MTARAVFLVPETLQPALVQALDEELVIRQLAHTFTTASKRTQNPCCCHRGKAMWTEEENAAITDSDHIIRSENNQVRMAVL